MHFSLFHATESLPATFIWEYWAIHCLHTHTTQCSNELYIHRIVRLLCFMHRALSYNYATWTNEMRTFQINTSIQFFNFWRLPHVSNLHENEPTMFKTCRRLQKLKKFDQSFNLKSVHFVGSCCIRILWHYCQRQQTSPCLILISLLFDDSSKAKKGTCCSDLAVVRSGRHDTHLVTLSSMSVAH